MDKVAVISLVRALLAEQYERALAAVAGAREAATGDDTRAENKYDTRGLEASYLAAGQAELVEQLEWALGKFDAADFDVIAHEGSIGPGALVMLQNSHEKTAYFLAPAGGGIEVTSPEGIVVTVLGPDSTLRHRLLGERLGAKLSRPDATVVGVF